jgi:hypothetical protein
MSSLRLKTDDARQETVSLLAEGLLVGSSSISAIRKSSVKSTSCSGNTLDTYGPALGLYNAFREG